MISKSAHRTAPALFAAFIGLVMLVYPPAAVAHPDESDRLSYVLYKSGEQGSTMSGSMDDLRRVRSMRSGSEALLYVRVAGVAYVIRDAATLRRAEAIFGPQQELGARQGELGRRQAALGRRQAQLGLEQGRLGRQQPGATPARAAELSRQQSALGRQQSALGDQQAVLGKQQAVLGREQQRLAHEADSKMRALLADAVKRGIAQRVD
jgi:hypothetical protein